MSTIWSSRALKRSFCPLSRRSFGRIANLSRLPDDGRESRLEPRLNLQVRRPIDGQSCNNEYFQIPQTSYFQGVSEFFTVDCLRTKK
jgi:hypothetical protein